VNALPYTTLAEHETLLAEKGYLEPNMGDTKLGDWLYELRTKFEECRFDATGSGRKKTFSIPASGKFNHGLEEVRFLLHYHYDPKNQALSLRTMETWLGRTRWIHFLNGRRMPPTPTEAYEKLRDREGPRRSDILLARLQQENDRRHDPANDPHLDMNHPAFNRVNDLHKDEEYPESKPNDLTSFMSRPSRRHR
jgi:hypothetical protein